jgi:hypothetical protein
VPPIVIPDQFKELVDSKQAPLAGAIAKCVALLGENPRHPGLQTHPVRGTRNPKVFEAYVDMKNRVTFHWDGDTIVLRNNCHHDIIKRP